MAARIPSEKRDVLLGSAIGARRQPLLVPQKMLCTSATTPSATIIAIPIQRSIPKWRIRVMGCLDIAVHSRTQGEGRRKP